MRTVILGLIALGLAVAVFVMWPRGSDDEPTGTAAAATTLTTTVAAPSTTTPDEPTTAAPDSHVVETVEEAEEILRELWFGWFEGIYDQDEDRIREVVVLEETVDTARESFGTMEFSGPPTIDEVLLDGLVILRSDDECLALWATLDVSAFRPDAVGTDGVYVIRWTDEVWKLLTVWTNRNDLWENDCESALS